MDLFKFKEKYGKRLRCPNIKVKYITSNCPYHRILILNINCHKTEKNELGMDQRTLLGGIFDDNSQIIFSIDLKKYILWVRCF